MTMKSFIGTHEFVAGDEALELALDLWLGDENESPEERAARLDAGRDILDEDPALFDRAVRVVAEALEDVPNVVLFRPRRRPSHPGVAA